MISPSQRTSGLQKVNSASLKTAQDQAAQVRARVGLSLCTQNVYVSCKIRHQAVGCDIMQAGRNLPTFQKNIIPSPIIMEAANSSEIPTHFTRLHGVTLQKTEIRIDIY